MTDGTGQIPEAVPGKEAKPAGEIQARWAWVEAAVWTERMLTALEEGVMGGKWHSLIDKVYALRNLRQAFARVKANHGGAGVDHVSVEEFERHLEANLEKLARELADGTYRPQAVRRAWINKLGSKEQRPLGIPTVRDQVVQAALRAVLEPIFERDFAAQSYGFRPKRRCKQALRRVEALLKQGYSWVVDADLKSYFDTIPRAALLARIQAKVSDGRILKLLEAYLTQGVLEEMNLWRPWRVWRAASDGRNWPSVSSSRRGGKGNGCAACILSAPPTAPCSRSSVAGNGPCKDSATGICKGCCSARPPPPQSQSAGGPLG